jgi:predicted RNA-binding protein YlqC (UPF0109 family)
MLKELVEHIVVHLLERPEVMVVTERLEDQKVIIDIQIDADDFKRVIGKEGRIIKSIRHTVALLSPHGMAEVQLEPTDTNTNDITF